MPVGESPSALALSALNTWGARLFEMARHAEHPFHAPLAVEALVAEGRVALAALAAPSAPSLGSEPVPRRVTADTGGPGGSVRQRP